MKFISKKEGKYFLGHLYKRLKNNNIFVQNKTSKNKVGKLPTTTYLVVNPNSTEDKFIDNDKRSLFNHKVGL